MPPHSRQFLSALFVASIPMFSSLPCLAGPGNPLPPDPGVRLITGNDQTLKVGSVSVPLEVEVVDAMECTISTTLVWSIVAGIGTFPNGASTIETATVRGRASVTVLAGSMRGPLRIRARVENPEDYPPDFRTHVDFELKIEASGPPERQPSPCTFVKGDFPSPDVSIPAWSRVSFSVVPSGDCAGPVTWTLDEEGIQGSSPENASGNDLQVTVGKGQGRLTAIASLDVDEGPSKQEFDVKVAGFGLDLVPPKAPEVNETVALIANASLSGLNVSELPTGLAICWTVEEAPTDARGRLTSCLKPTGNLSSPGCTTDASTPVDRSGESSVRLMLGRQQGDTAVKADLVKAPFENACAASDVVATARITLSPQAPIDTPNLSGLERDIGNEINRECTKENPDSAFARDICDRITNDPESVDEIIDAFIPDEVRELPRAILNSGLIPGVGGPSRLRPIGSRRRRQDPPPEDDAETTGTINEDGGHVDMVLKSDPDWYVYASFALGFARSQGRRREDGFSITSARAILGAEHVWGPDRPLQMGAMLVLSHADGALGRDGETQFDGVSFTAYGRRDTRSSFVEASATGGWTTLSTLRAARLPGDETPRFARGKTPGTVLGAHIGGGWHKEEGNGLPFDLELSASADYRVTKLQGFEEQGAPFALDFEPIRLDSLVLTLDARFERRFYFEPPPGSNRGTDAGARRLSLAPHLEIGIRHEVEGKGPSIGFRIRDGNLIELPIRPIDRNYLSAEVGVRVRFNDNPRLSLTYRTDFSRTGFRSGEARIGVSIRF